MNRQKEIIIGLLALVLSWSFTCLGESAAKLQDVEIATEKQLSVKNITFPAVTEKNGKIVVLKARIFYKAAVPSGWNNVSKISLNGKILGRKTASGSERLLRRGEAMKLAKENRAWFDNNNGLLIMCGPGEGEVDKRILAPRAEGYWYYFDISDLVSSKNPNVLQFRNGLVAAFTGGEKRPLTAKDMEIIYIPKDGKAE